MEAIRKDPIAPTKQPSRGFTSILELYFSCITKVRPDVHQQLYIDQQRIDLESRIKHLLLAASLPSPHRYHDIACSSKQDVLDFDWSFKGLVSWAALLRPSRYTCFSFDRKLIHPATRPVSEPSHRPMRTMLSVASLLNPLPPAVEPVEQQNPLPSPCSTLYSPEASPRTAYVKKQKLCKDEATFVKGKPQADVKYWPCEYQDEHAAAEHKKYKLYPIGQIAEYCKHVPYRSEKKTFLSKTGREGFHVFQYTFQMPHDDKRQTVMWDYNNGLVRITPFFKALEYPKAAKAVAATFCYRIRYVLTPIFGLDFPAQCIPPGAPGFDSMRIAPKIIRECIEAARDCNGVRQRAQKTSRPETPTSAGVTNWTPANVQPKSLRRYDSESGYGTDTERKDAYLYSPTEPPGHGFKSLTTPRSVGMQRKHKPIDSTYRTSSPYGYESETSDDCRKRKRNPPKYGNEDYESSSTDSSEDSPAPAPAKRRKASNTPTMATEGVQGQVDAVTGLLELKLWDPASRGRASGTPRRRATA
ncbi:MAG: hypothetical protein Q9181_001498 [Wetmoreana brouardii]